MEKKIEKFDLEAAFKALDEIEVPESKSTDRNGAALLEAMKHGPKTDILVEDYYDVNDQADMVEAKDEREDEIAKAKLAKIEKIVDLDADSPEDLQPSYIGKTIIQCPQCMTLFYKDPADIVASEDDPTVVNVAEVCQHCGNDAGYTVIGKVGEAEPEEAENFEGGEEAPAEENPDELNLDFEEPEAEEKPAEENAEEEPELTPVETEEETEEKKESLTSHIADTLLEDFDDIGAEEEIPAEEVTAEPMPVEEVAAVVEETAEEIKEVVEATEEQAEAIDEVVEEKKEEICPECVEESSEEEAVEEPVEESLTEETKVETEKCEDGECCKKTEVFTELPDFNVEVEQKGEKVEVEVTPKEEKVEESLTEDVDPKELTKKLTDWNNYIEYLQNKIKFEEDALNKAGDNEFVKAAIQRRIDALKADLDEALPEKVKAETAITELPTPEEAGADKKESLKESVEDELNKFIAGLDEGIKEEICPVCGDDVKEPCEDCKKELDESPEIEAKVDEFEAEVNESCKKCNEDLPAEVEVAGEEAVDKLKNLNKQAEEEIAAEEAPVEEALDKPDEIKVPEATNAEFGKMINSDVFKRFGEELEEDLPSEVEAAGEEAIAKLNALNAEAEEEIADEEVTVANEFEDIHEESVNESITNFLNKVYENVDSFNLTECQMNGDNLILEGIINFKSGVQNNTTFNLTKTKVEGCNTIFEGYNETFGKDSKFTLTAINEAAGKILVTESLNYSYKIGETLVEGLVK